LTEENFQSVLDGEAKLSISCLIRLRMYQLFDSIEEGPEGDMIFVLNLTENGRVKILNPKC
jgi:hypothetical protein